MNIFKKINFGLLILMTMGFGLIPRKTEAVFFLGSPSIEDLQAKIAKLPAGTPTRQKGNLYSELGTRLYHAGRMADAAAAFQSALENKTSRSQRRHIYLFLGKSFESSGRPDKAIEAYEQAIHYDPKNWRRYRELGVMYQSVKLNRQAIEVYEKAIRLNPAEPTLYYQIGSTWRDLRLTTYAEANLKK